MASEKRHQLGRYYHRHSQYDQKYYCNEIIILDQAIVNLRYRCDELRRNRLQLKQLELLME